jgi:hypothetical protein
MLLPETSTYAARPPSDCGRRYCAQKRQTRIASEMPAALFVRSKAARSCAKRGSRGTRIEAALLLALIVSVGTFAPESVRANVARSLTAFWPRRCRRCASREFEPPLMKGVDVHGHRKRDRTPLVVPPASEVVSEPA